MKQRRIAAVLAGSLMTAAMGAFVAPIAHAKGPDPVATVSKQAQLDAIKYWTPERMAKAKSLDVRRFAASRTPRSNVEVGKKRVIRASSASNDPNAEASDQVGAPWTKGGQIAKTTGKVFFTDSESDVDYVCSGSVGPANNKSVIITAGHCVNNANEHQDDSGDKQPGTFMKNWLFVPGYHSSPGDQTDVCDSTVCPYGEYAASKLTASDNWINKADYDYDVGLATVSGQVNGPNDGALPENAQGSQGLGFNLPRHQYVEFFGYPAGPRPSEDSGDPRCTSIPRDPACPWKYDGTRLDYSASYALNADENGVSNSGNSTAKDDPGGSNDQLIESDLTGGSSGGPWLYDFDEATGTGTQISVESFSYAGISSTDQAEYKIPANNSWGPYFGSAIEDLWDKVQGSNPTAAAKSVTTPEDTAKDVALSGTKSNPHDPEALTFAIKSQPSHGKVTRSGSTATYTPDKNFNGKDTFTYVASNGLNASAPATVTVNVTPVNDAPTAADVTATTAYTQPVDITLKGTDPDKGDTLTYTVVNQASDSEEGGKVTIDGDTATYTPGKTTGETAAQKVTFTYKANDGTTDSNVATGTITVQPNSAPVGKPDSYHVDSADTLSIKAPGVLTNDTDADGDDLSAVLVGTAPDGLNFKSDGSFTYDAPKTYQDKTVTFQYRATDGIGDPQSAKANGAANLTKKSLAFSENTTVTIYVAAQASPSPTPSPSEPPSSPTPSPSEPPSSQAPTTGPTSAPPSSEAPNGPLGDTGSPFSPAVIGFGLLTVAAGAGTLIAARRRRS